MKERRKWFRVDNPVALSYEILEEQEMQQRIAELKRGGFPAGGISATLFGFENEIQEKLANVRRNSPDVAKVLELLNDKLNALVNILPLLEDDEENLIDQPLRDGNLSASGIAFANEEELAPGTPIFLKLVLAPNYNYVEAYARVVRTTTRENSRKYPFMVAVEFLMITDAQREMLVRYTMAKETEILRARRARA